MNLEKVYIGCSSYLTPSWQPLFYPHDLPKKVWFEYYCRCFNTYEFNGSFYRMPTVKNLQTWFDRTPNDFKFSIKIPKTITHLKKLQDCEKEVKDFYNVVLEGLKFKLACILWQFPPSFNFTPEKLSMLIELIDSNFKNVIEFRHIGWFQKDIMHELELHNCTFCNTDYPNLPNTMLKNTSIGYVRLHGLPKLFYSEYSDSEIEKLYVEIKDKEFSEAYVYFNNTASTAGIQNALQLLDKFKPQS